MVVEVFVQGLNMRSINSRVLVESVMGELNKEYSILYMTDEIFTLNNLTEVNLGDPIDELDILINLDERKILTVTGLDRIYSNINNLEVFLNNLKNFSDKKIMLFINDTGNIAYTSHIKGLVNLLKKYMDDSQVWIFIINQFFVVPGDCYKLILNFNNFMATLEYLGFSKEMTIRKLLNTLSKMLNNKTSTLYSD